MAEIKWHQPGAKQYELGVDRGVLFPVNLDSGAYGTGVAWNGLTNVSQSPSGAEQTKHYADNTVYATTQSAEEFAATIEAFTYPTEFGKCDGSAEVLPGVEIGQQLRVPFGFAYRKLIGNDTKGIQAGYKLHLLYGLTAKPSENAAETINDSPEPSTFSWECDSVPVDAGDGYQPTARVTINSMNVQTAKLKAIEDILYGRGTGNTNPRLPLPTEVFTILAA